jgi:hypothetical protein
LLHCLVGLHDPIKAGLEVEDSAEYVGSYFFADYCGGWINRVDAPATGNAVSTFASGISFPVDLQVGPDGFLYYLAWFGLDDRSRRSDPVRRRRVRDLQCERTAGGQGRNAVLPAAPGVGRDGNPYLDEDLGYAAPRP